MSGWSGSIPAWGGGDATGRRRGRCLGPCRRDAAGGGGDPDIAPLVDPGQPLGRRPDLSLAPVESDVPERSVRRVPALTSWRPSDGWPADLPRPVRLLRSAAADRGDGAAARSSAGRVHLAAGAPPCAPRRWARTHRRRMVEARPRMGLGARLFRVEDEDGRRFWLFRRGDGSDGHRRYALVPAWVFLNLAGALRSFPVSKTYVQEQNEPCKMHSHDPALHRTTGHHELQFPARRLPHRGTDRPRRRPGHDGARRHRPELVGRHRAGASAGKEAGIRLIVGCRLDLVNGPSVLVYPTSRAGYARLTRLLTLGKGRAGKGKCELHWPDLAAAAEGLIAILCTDPTRKTSRRLKADFGDRAYVALTLMHRPNDAVRLRTIADTAQGPRRARPSPPTTCCITRPAGVSCRMC